jgi:hypothetical protein
MNHQLICIQSDHAEKAIIIATVYEARGLKAKKQSLRSRNVTLKKLRAKTQRRKESPLEHGSALRLCAFAREIFALI